MIDDNTPKSTKGLFTRFGAEIIDIKGFGHDWLEADDFFPRRGTWWANCTLKDPKYKDTWDAEIDMCRIVYDDKTYPESKGNMNELSKACMDYLNEKGYWDNKGLWIPNDE